MNYSLTSLIHLSREAGSLSWIACMHTYIHHTGYLRRWNVENFFWCMLEELLGEFNFKILTLTLLAVIFYSKFHVFLVFLPLCTNCLALFWQSLIFFGINGYSVRRSFKWLLNFIIINLSGCTCLCYAWMNMTHWGGLYILFDCQCIFIQYISFSLNLLFNMNITL